MGNAHQMVKDAAGMYFDICKKKTNLLLGNTNRFNIDLVTLDNIADGVAVVLEQISKHI
jgi:hypothetical protein